MARPIPVLPLELSTIVLPGVSRPSRSAASIMASADETTTPDAYTIPLLTRHFKFTYHVEVQAPAGAKTVEVWLPVAHSSELQAVKLLAPEPERDPATGNEYRHTSLAGGATF